MRVRRLRISMILLLAAAVAIVGLGPAPASAQTPFVPYFGKNQIRFFQFQWKVYQTDHFEIYLLPVDRTAPAAGRRLRGKRLLPHQRRTETRPPEPDPDHPVQDAERVPDQQRVRRACRKACSRLPNRNSAGWCCRSTSRRTSSTG